MESGIGPRAAHEQHHLHRRHGRAVGRLAAVCRIQEGVLHFATGLVLGVAVRNHIAAGRLGLLGRRETDGSDAGGVCQSRRSADGDHPGHRDPKRTIQPLGNTGAGAIDSGYRDHETYPAMGILVRILAGAVGSVVLRIDRIRIQDRHSARTPGYAGLFAKYDAGRSLLADVSGER